MGTRTEETTTDTRQAVAYAAKVSEQGESPWISLLTTDYNVLAIGDLGKENTFEKINAVKLCQSQAQDQTISRVLDFVRREIKPSPRDISRESQNIQCLLHYGGPSLS